MNFASVLQMPHFNSNHGCLSQVRILIRKFWRRFVNPPSFGVLKERKSNVLLGSVNALLLSLWPTFFTRAFSGFCPSMEKRTAAKGWSDAGCYIKSVNSVLPSPPPLLLSFCSPENPFLEPALPPGLNPKSANHWSILLSHMVTLIILISTGLDYFIHLIFTVWVRLFSPPLPNVICSQERQLFLLRQAWTDVSNGRGCWEKDPSSDSFCNPKRTRSLRPVNESGGGKAGRHWKLASLRHQPNRWRVTNWLTLRPTDIILHSWSC